MPESSATADSFVEVLQQAYTDQEKDALRPHVEWMIGQVASRLTEPSELTTAELFSLAGVLIPINARLLAAEAGEAAKPRLLLLSDYQTGP